MPAWKQRLSDLYFGGQGRRYSNRRFGYRRFYRGAMYGRAAARALGGARRYPWIARRSAYNLRRATGAIRTTNWNRYPEELKYLDTNFASYPVDTVNAVAGDGVYLINGIAAGSTAITREGRQAFWKSVSVTGTIATVDATTQASRGDVVIVWDKQPGAAVPAMTDLFVESKAGSPMNLNYRERFVVLAHRTYVIGGLTADATDLTPTVHSVNINVRLNLRTTFKGDANAIGDIATGYVS